MNLVRTRTVFAIGVAALAAGCGDDDPPPRQSAPTCTPGSTADCEDGQVCEEVEGGGPACFAPLLLRGHVFDVSDEAPVEGALVVARDANSAAISPVATTNAAGEYTLRVPGKRLPGGALASGDVTLRADASGYLPFPKAPRVAVPIDLTVATGEPLAVESALTEIGLIPHGTSDDVGSISGRVLSSIPGGTLLVAAGVTGIADVNGDYTIFDVPAGSVSVEGYSPGVNLESQTVDLAADEAETGVDLAVIGDATAIVSGNVQIVNASGGLTTSVILVVESTFDEMTARGEAPPGLRAGDVSGAWSIAGVPDGHYLALAAFENDDLVRDPDTSIGGTDIIDVVVDGASVSLSDGFKVTGALAVVGPGVDAPEQVSAPFELSWEDDSSEDSYDLVVFDALGNLTWEETGIVGPRGSAPVVVGYEGPTLEPGMYYQFRATSIKDGVPISATEDLRGVFFAR
jgi:hypothetical protein